MKHLLHALTLFAATLAHAQEDPSVPLREARATSRDVTYFTPRVGLWNMGIHGRLESDDSPALGTIIDGTTLSFSEDLGIENQTLPVFELVHIEDVGGAAHETSRFGFLYGRFDGTAVLGTPETFNAMTYPAGSTLDSSLRFWHLAWDGAFDTFEAVPGLYGEAFGGIRIWQSTVRIENPGGGDNDERVRLGLIGLGFALRSTLGEHLSIGGRTAAFISTGGQDDLFEFEEFDAGQFEFSLGLTLNLRRLRVEAGYRLLSLEADIFRIDSDRREHDEWSLGFDGPYVEFSFRF